MLQSLLFLRDQLKSRVSLTALGNSLFYSLVDGLPCQKEIAVTWEIVMFRTVLRTQLDACQVLNKQVSIA